MEDMLMKSMHEINQSQAKFHEKTDKTSKALLQQKDDIQKLSDSFLSLTKRYPWIFQKCSLRGLYIARQCLNCIREDSNLLCQQEMFTEMERLSKELGDYKE